MWDLGGGPSSRDCSSAVRVRAARHLGELGGGPRGGSQHSPVACPIAPVSATSTAFNSNRTVQRVYQIRTVDARSAGCATVDTLWTQTSLIRRVTVVNYCYVFSRFTPFSAL